MNERPVWRCCLCGEKFRSDDLIDHYRLFHPDQDVVTLDRWPDGELVVYDDWE